MYRGRRVAMSVASQQMKEKAVRVKMRFFLTMKKKKNIYLELADGLASPLLDPIYWLDSWLRNMATGFSAGDIERFRNII